MWSEFDNHFSQLKFVVKGLTNSHKSDEKLLRVLVLSFERAGDGFNVSRSELKYLGKKWEYIWMWDQDITVPVPTDAKDPQIKVSNLKTATGSERHLVAFPFEIKNSTKTNQEISITNVALALPIEVEIGGVKVPLEARINDDGFSTISKAAMLKELSVDSTKDRYQNKTLVDGSKTQVERRKIMIESGKAADKNWAVFDQNDVDWDDAVDQVESFLSAAWTSGGIETVLGRTHQERRRGRSETARKESRKFVQPRRSLNEDEVKALKEQIAKALPDAIEKAKAKKNVTAYFNAVSGMSPANSASAAATASPAWWTGVLAQSVGRIGQVGSWITVRFEV